MLLSVLWINSVWNTLAISVPFARDNMDSELLSLFAAGKGL